MTIDSGYLRWGPELQFTQEVAVNFLIEEGLKPMAIIRLTSTQGKVSEVLLSNNSLLRLVAALHADPRFRIDTRRTKPDKDLEAEVEELFQRLKGD